MEKFKSGSTVATMRKFADDGKIDEDYILDFLKENLENFLYNEEYLDKFNEYLKFSEEHVSIRAIDLAEKITKDRPVTNIKIIDAMINCKNTLIAAFSSIDVKTTIELLDRDDLPTELRFALQRNPELVKHKNANTEENLKKHKQLRETAERFGAIDPEIVMNNLDLFSENILLNPLFKDNKDIQNYFTLKKRCNI